MNIYNEGNAKTYKSPTIMYYILYVPYKILQFIYLKSYSFGKTVFYSQMVFAEIQRKVKGKLY